MHRGGQGIKWDDRVFMWNHKLIGYMFSLTNVLYPTQICRHRSSNIPILFSVSLHLLVYKILILIKIQITLPSVVAVSSRKNTPGPSRRAQTWNHPQDPRSGNQIHIQNMSQRSHYLKCQINPQTIEILKTCSCTVITLIASAASSNNNAYEYRNKIMCES